MRILTIQPFLRGYTVYPFPGGKDKICYQLAQASVANGHDLFVLPWNNEHVFEAVQYSLSENGLFATVLPNVHFPTIQEFVASIPRLLADRSLPRHPVRRGKSLLRELALSQRVALKRAMELVEPDVVHLHHTHSNFAQVYREMKYTVPLMLTHYSWGIAPNLAQFDVVVFVSETQREYVCTIEPAVRRFLSRVIYCPVDDEYHTSAMPRPIGAILFVATLTSRNFAHEKGLDLLLDAYAADPDLNQWPLYVVGDGPPRQTYEGESKSRDINVKFMARLTAPEIAELMSKCGCFVMPSRREGLATVYLEALCMGLPIIGYPPNVHDLSQKLSMKVGFPFDASEDNHLQLISVIKEAMSEDSGFDIDHRREMLRRARKSFSLKRFVVEYMKLYKEVSSSVSGST